MLKEVLYLGPKGSFSEFALNNFEQILGKDIKKTPLDSIYKIVRTLKTSNNDSLCAVIPIENSIEGIVRDTQDNLNDLSLLGYRIYAETQLAVEHSLVGFGTKADIKTISSHPQALAQCREYSYNIWGDDISLNPTLSTSSAISSLKKENPNIAAIGNEYCAKLYNIPILEKEINDKKNNTTRFLLISKKEPTKSCCNKICITFSTENKPGALNKILNILEKYKLNMSYIDSRPSRCELGEYIFYVDFAGHVEDVGIAMALVEIQQNVKMLEILSKGAICV